jgi:hypothetical protein
MRVPVHPALSGLLPTRGVLFKANDAAEMALPYRTLKSRLLTQHQLAAARIGLSMEMGRVI